jgi:hypothetical protein
MWSSDAAAAAPAITQFKFMGGNMEDERGCQYIELTGVKLHSGQYKVKTRGSNAVGSAVPRQLLR